MSGPVRWKKILCFSFIILTLFVHFYIVSNTQAATYFKNKLSNLSNPLMWVYQNRRPEKVHVILLSYARTGSSFLGDLLQSHPQTFYHFEPLHFVSSSVLNSSFSEARSLLHRLFTCNVTHIPGFLTWQKQHLNFMKLKRNLQYWKNCSVRKSCYNSTYIDNFCSKFHAVVLKTIRLPLKHAVPMFQEYPDLNLKIIYLARDPRGTLNSRHKYPISAWCRKDPVCFKSKTFCSSLEDDLRTSCALLNERPNDFMIIRYEDLSQDPYGVSKKILDFLEMPEADTEMESFIKSHTSISKSGPDKKKLDGLEFSYATFRNSTETAFRWRKDTSFPQTLNIQKDCKEVLPKLGYHIYTTSGTLKSNINFDEPLEGSLRKACSTR